MQTFKSSYLSCLHIALGIKSKHEGRAAIYCVQYINIDVQYLRIWLCLFIHVHDEPCVSWLPCPNALKLPARRLTLKRESDADVVDSAPLTSKPKC